MREYLPTLGELIDRLTICQLKEVKIPNKKSEYGQEIKQIVSDINKIIKESDNLEFDGDLVRAIVVLSQMNTHIWVNEDNARKGDNQGNELLLTHGLNGIRNTAKNKIQEKIGGRKDYKIDCLASEFSDWEISWGEPIDNNKWDITINNSNPGGYSFQVFQKKDSDFQIITTAKCGTRWLDNVTGFDRVKDNEKQIQSAYWNLRMTENNRWRWFQIEFTYEYQVKMNIQNKEKELKGLKYLWNWDKKDTLLLYRNPIDRIKSGILQKYNSWYNPNKEFDNKSGKTFYKIDSQSEKDFKKQLQILKDKFTTIFPHLHMKDSHCSPWSTYSLQLMDDLKITPRIYVNLDLSKKSNQNEDLDKWLKAVGSEEEIERINKLDSSFTNSNESIFSFGDEIDLHKLIQPLITHELISYNILEQKRSKL